MTTRYDHGVTSERLAKLPVWAQDHIESLTRRLRNAREDVRNAEAGNPDTPFLLDADHGEDPRTVPCVRDRVHVRNLSGRGKWGNSIPYDFTIEVKDDGRLLIRGIGSIAVVPRTSNSVEINYLDTRTKKK